MGLILRGQTVCRICGRIIENGEAAIASPHFIGDINDELYQYSDAAFHTSCFMSWHLRKKFVDKFNFIMKNFPLGGGRYRQMLDDGQIVMRQE